MIYSLLVVFLSCLLMGWFIAFMGWVVVDSITPLARNPYRRLELLKQARALIEQPHHWIQGQMRCEIPSSIDIDYGYCLVGALGAVVGNRNLNGLICESQLALMNDLKFSLGYGEDSLLHLTAWNDYPGRSHHEVLDLLDQAILGLERGSNEYSRED